MAHRVQVECSTCRGSGTSVPPETRCGACAATGLVDGAYSATVVVVAGHNMLLPVIVRGEGNQEFGVPSGDIVVTLTQTPDPVYVQVVGSHLVCKRTISLCKALTGFSFLLPHFRRRIDDDADRPQQRRRQLRIRSTSGLVVRPGGVFVVSGHGMPTCENPNVYGDLSIHFEITFPNDHFLANKADTGALAALLGRVAVFAAAPGSGEAARGNDGGQHDDDDDDVVEAASEVIEKSIVSTRLGEADASRRRHAEFRKDETQSGSQREQFNQPPRQPQCATQ
jgi:DnaJ-class molecular chaperone